MDKWLKTGRLLSVEKTVLTSTSKSSTSSVPSENSTSHCEAAPPQKLTVENEASLSKEYTQINFSKGKKRRYDEEYLSFGFIPIGVEKISCINTNIISIKISWQKCVDVCTDGAAAMVGKIKGVITRIKEVAPKCSNSHCVLHRHALATKKLSPDLKSALDVAVQCVNFIKELSSIEYESLLEVKSSSELKIKFGSLKIEEFWIAMESDYEQLSIKAITVLLPFATSYLCETGFSAYTKTKNKFRNQLNAAPDLRIQLSGITPDLKTIMKKTMERFQSSH